MSKAKEGQNYSFLALFQFILRYQILKISLFPEYPYFFTIPNKVPSLFLQT